MSWDVSFCDPVSGKVIELDHKHEMHGGTYAIGGTNQLTLNITYNYGEQYNKYDFYIDDLEGKSAVDVIPELERVIALLGDDVDDEDYWNPTEGNAKRALVQLLVMAKMRPDARIVVD